MSQMNKEITSKILKMYENFFLPTPSTPTIHSAPKQKIEISHTITSLNTRAYLIGGCATCAPVVYI